MAGILDPKTRFFDTYLTKEGRRQLSSGELRMRFVSFSDGLTTYDQSEFKVIDPKDGSPFFEAMSRPQDSIITENESIVNMMEVREEGERPAFLFTSGSDGVTRPVRASMFGTTIMEPPDGRKVVKLSTAGIDRAGVSYNPLSSFYISGSSTQEVLYDDMGGRLRGWWLFDEFQSQLATVSDPLGAGFRFLFENNKISQNLSASSDLSTNAAYLVHNSPSNTADASPTFESSGISNPSIRAFSDEGKSWNVGDQSKKFIRLNLTASNYNNSGLIQGSGYYKNKYSSQISVWFYVNQAGIDSEKNNTVIQLFDTYVKANGAKVKLPVAEVFTISNHIKLKLYNYHDGLTPDANLGYSATKVYERDNVISANKWHRVSLAFDHNYVFLVVDGTLEKSLRLKVPIKEGKDVFSLTSSSDLILGNSFTNGNVLNNSSVHSILGGGTPDSFLNGYILDCQYFLVPSGSDLPAIPKEDNFNAYDTLIETTGSLIASQQNNHLLSFRSGRTNKLYSYYGLPVESNINLRKWVHYYPIPGEAALYWSHSSKTYVKENLMERGVKPVEMSELLDKVSMVMSGTLHAYQELKLLGHLDLNVSNDQQGLEITRQELVRVKKGRYDSVIEPGPFRKLDLDNPTVFKTRLESFPFIESVYGQQNDYRKEDFIPHARMGSGPTGGRFFEREATVYHLNEIMDNELDNDDLTFSSSRLPNFFFLPPISQPEFVFSDVSDPVTVRSAMSWTEFMRRRAAQTVWFGTARGEQPVSKYMNRYVYQKQMHQWFQTLLPKETISNMLKTFKPDENDSNEDVIYYLTRDVNSTPENEIDFENLEMFSELITFKKTSELNNSFVQMFEAAEVDGKPSFKKLAIRDLGVVRREKASYKRSFRGSRENNIAGDLSGAFEAIENNDDDYPELAHVFAFGKIMHDKSDPKVPGTDIYFFPIFTIEFIIGDD